MSASFRCLGMLPVSTISYLATELDRISNWLLWPQSQIELIRFKLIGRGVKIMSPQGQIYTHADIIAGVGRLSALYTCMCMYVSTSKTTRKPSCR